jgi:TniQ
MTVVPKPLPDELALSIAARARLLRGDSGDDRLDSKSSRQDGLLPALASALNMPLIELLRRHTLMPFYALVQAKGTAWEHMTPGASRIAAGRGGGRQPHLCCRCVAEDIGFWGVSYWRRAHQIPGVVECEKHREALRIALSRNQHSLPQDHVDSAVPISAALVDHFRSNDCIARYARIAIEVLNARAPVSTEQMVKCLQVATAKTQRPWGRKRGEHLSDLVAQRTAGPWLFATFPEFHIKRRGVGIPTIDRTYSARGVAQRTVAYVLVLAALHESADDALLSLSNPPATRRAIEARNEETSDKLSRAVKLFLQGLPIGEACKRTRVSTQLCEAAVRDLLQASRALTS